VIDSEDYAPQDPEVQEKSDLQSEGNSQPTETPTETETETPTETETENYERESLAEYRAGSDLVDAADRRHIDGQNAYANESYEQAEEAYQSALESSQNAEERFDQAADLASFADREEAVQIAEAASAYMDDIFIPFSDLGKAASVARQRGEPERAERFEADAEGLNEEAERRQNNNNAVADVIEFRETLGLD
jgi:tetratricopeptide (TPR) repeat protein